MPAAYPNAYTDVARTRRGPYSQVVTNAQPKVGNGQARTDVYDVAGTDVGHKNPSAVSPPHSPVAWRRGRDPYANGGGAGQPFLNNQG